MTEKLLQYIWQFQHFNRNNLITNRGEKLQVIEQGKLNTSQGPDFLDGKIVIENTILAGTIELHVRTSDWNRHGHTSDHNYRNVILHVVWDDDQPVNNLPVLELKERVSKLLLDRYENLVNSLSFIPCENLVNKIPPLTWSSWTERLIAERWEKRSGEIQKFLEQNQYHWEETFWWMLARNFGLRVNADVFEMMARTLPMNILAKHKNQVLQLEALLFGQAGLLHAKLNDGYAKMLYREYQFLKKKYGLNPVFHPIHFLRMRPGNFPTIRLAQLAALISQSAHLFSRVREEENLEAVINWFNVQANDYWHYHYRFDTASSFKIKTLGKDMIDNLVINTITPVLYKYGDYLDEVRYREKAIRWLQELEPEKNRITTGFELLGIKNKSAFDSQALLELKKEYCDVKRCLECAVGNYLLRL